MVKIVQIDQIKIIKMIRYITELPEILSYVKTFTLLNPDISCACNLTMSHYQVKTSSLDPIKPNILFAAKSMTANGVTV
jgi:hypothetical protein